MNVGCYEFSLDLYESLVAPFIRKGILLLRKNSEWPVMDFVKFTADAIRAAGLFKLESLEEIFLLSKAFQKAIESSKLITQELKDKVLAEYENHLFKAFSLETDTIPETETDLIIKNLPEDIDNESETSESKTLDHRVDSLYGTAARVKDYMLRQFRNSIVETSLVNFKERKRIKTVRDLNTYIAKYKNELFKSLFDYLKDNSEENGVTFDDSIVDYIYNDEGIPNVENMQKLMQIADDVLYDLDRDMLNSAFSSKRILIDGLPKNQQLINAFNAYVLLSNGNFDKILQSVQGKDFVIKKIYAGKETDVNNEKYKFHSSANYRKSWNDTNVDAIKEMGGVSKLFIETTPIIDHITGLIKEDRFLDPKMFFSTFNKLMDQETIRRFPKKIKDLATMIKGNSNDRIRQILEHIVDPKNNNTTFGTNDMDIFRSVYERFYNPNRPDSLYSIMKADYESSPVALTYDLLEVISGAIFRTNSAKFVQYKHDKDTQDMVATEITQSNAVGKRLKIEGNIEAFTKIRPDRKSLIDRYNLQLVNSSNGQTSFDIPMGKDTYRFSYDPTANVGAKLKVWKLVNGEPQIIALANIMREPSFKDLKDYYEKNAPITPELRSSEQQIYVKLVEYLDDMLDMGFLQGNLDLLEQFRGLFGVSNTRYLTESLMNLASSAALANYVYNEYENLSEDDKPENIGEFMKTLDIYTDLKEDLIWKTRYNAKTNTIKIVYPATLDTVDKLSDALRIISGEMYKTVVKNADGNNIAVNRMSNLANETRYYLTDRVVNNSRSTVKDNLFANNLDNIFGVAIREDAVSRNNVRKSAAKFTEAEHGYASIVLDFYGKLISEVENKHKVAGLSAKYVQIQPTVYSDKTAFYVWKVGTIYKIGDTILDIEKATPQQLNDAIKSTIGQQYKKTYDAVFLNYRTVLEFIISLFDRMGETFLNQPFVNRMREIAEMLSTSKNKQDLARGKAILKVYDKIIKKYPDYLAKLEAFRNKLNEVDSKNQEIARKNLEFIAAGQLNRVKALIAEPVAPDFMSNFSDSEIVTILSATPMGLYESTSYELGLHNIANLHTAKLSYKNIDGKFIKPNNLLRYNATKLYADDATYDQQMLREKKRFVKDLVQFNLTFPLVYSDGKVNQVLQKAIDKYGGPGFAVNWVNTDTKELILAKQDGNPVSIFNPIEDIRDGKNIELNPLLERYFLSDALISGNLKIATSGFELAHPNKSKAGDELNMANAELEEASRAGAQYKRNVIITATKLGYSQYSIMGVTPTMKVAVMGDVEAKVYNINGIESEVDAHDGSADNNMLWHILENLSLQDAAVGEDAKPILHDYTDFGTARLFKYATFGLYNERLRKSQTSPINQYTQFKKLNGFVWDEKIPDRYANPDQNWTIELGRNIYGRQFTLKDIMNNDRLFFRRGNKHYEILSIDRMPDGLYARTVREVDANGNYIGMSTQEAPMLVNTNAALHDILGGVHSESLKGGKVKSLSYSDASLYATVAYMNNTGIYMGNGEYPSQLNTYQPLKYALIACQINGSAMKVGPEYTNSSKLWYDANTGLRVMEIATDGIGTQMDADHIVTDSEHQSTMTEFSQVISALEANGTTHDISKQAYRDLGKVAVAAMADVEQAIKDFLESDFSAEGKSKIYEIVGLMMVRELIKDGKNLGLSQSIVAKVKEEFAKKLKNLKDAKFHMPFSDPSIFGKALASFTSTINKTAIKRKFPGMGAVMVPAYDKTMNFNINGLNLPGGTLDVDFDLSYDDIYKLAADNGFLFENGEVDVQGFLDSILKARETAIDPETGKLKYLWTTDRILPNDIVKVADDKGNIIDTINIQTMADYRRAKSYGYYFKVVNKPLNLKPMDIHWMVGGRQFNLYDLPQVLYAFQIRGDYKARDEKVPRQLDLQIQKGINDALDLLQKGFMTVQEGGEIMLINGGTYQVVSVDQGSLVNNPAEIILSKIYAEKFGLQPQDTLHDVMSQGADFFIKRYENYHTPKTHNYDVCFTRADGRHVYIAYNDSGIKKNLAANKIDDSEQYVRDGMNLYRVDEDGNRLYRAGAYDENDKLTMLVESYSTTDSDEVMEVLVVKNNEQILELYDSSEYDSILFNRNAKELGDRLIELVEKGAEEEQDGFVRMQRALYNAVKDEEGNVTKERVKYRDFIQRLNVERKEHITEQALKKFVSFQKSLEYTVARIPAQTLQSFMKMKAVQFADSDKNVVYVTHWQTWLLGSDY